MTPETYSNGHEDTHYVFLKTDWPDMTGDDGREFEADSLTITWGEEAGIGENDPPTYSCHVLVAPDSASDDAPEWEGRPPQCTYSSHAQGPKKGLAPQWIVDIVLRHRPDWYPKDPLLIPRPERSLRAV